MLSHSLGVWVSRVAEHTKPETIRWCDGSALEARSLEDRMVADGTVQRLNEQLYPRSFLHRSSPTDVDCAPRSTFVCSNHRIDAGPTNQWMDPDEAERHVWPLFRGAMKGRTMYVVPYVLGPAASKYSRLGVQITDSAYVVANMRMLTRMGEIALERLRTEGRFVKGIHSVGDLSPDRRFVCHFPHAATIWSVGFSVGDNAFLSRTCHALRIAGVEARDEGWMAEHMAVVGITDPNGTTHYVAAAFPTEGREGHLAMLEPSLPGWKIETLSDHACWMHIGPDGALRAINPEAGFFGAVADVGTRANANAFSAVSHDALFTNVALRDGGVPWWEGLSPLRDGETLMDWCGRPWASATSVRAAHPNARFTIAARNWPTVGASFEYPTGVPISAIIFGGRRSRLAPLVYESFSWAHGVYIGATLVAEPPSASGVMSEGGNDPMAMRPFCGFNMADYFAHWLSIGKRLERPPTIFHVNWFRTGEDGKLLWPGSGENIRVLQWILERIDGAPGARRTAIGYVPRPGALNLHGLDIGPDRFEQLVAVDPDAWMREVERNGSFLETFGDRTPLGLRRQHDALVARLRTTLS